MVLRIPSLSEPMPSMLWLPQHDLEEAHLANLH